MSQDITDNSKKALELERIKNMLIDKINHDCEEIIESNFQSEKKIETFLLHARGFNIYFEPYSLMADITPQKIEAFLKEYIKGKGIRIKEKGQDDDNSYFWHLYKAHRDDYLGIRFDGSSIFVSEGGWDSYAYGFEGLEMLIIDWKNGNNYFE